MWIIMRIVSLVGLEKSTVAQKMMMEMLFIMVPKRTLISLKMALVIHGQVR